MSGKRFTDEFKLGAVKQVTESGHPVAEVAVRLGVSQPTLYQWIKKFSMPEPERIELQGQATEIRKLKAECNDPLKSCSGHNSERKMT